MQFWREYLGLKLFTCTTSVLPSKLTISVVTRLSVSLTDQSPSHRLLNLSATTFVILDNHTRLVEFELYFYFARSTSPIPDGWYAVVLLLAVPKVFP